MKTLKMLALGTLIAAASAGAMARPLPVHGAQTPHIDARQAEQAARIESAWHDGRLSRREYRSLQREQAEIRRYEAAAKADGFVTHEERRTLQHMLDRASRHIARA
jgi:uncharacterized membrane protein YebE (DUF533 family)